MRSLGFDIGGSTIRGAVVDVDGGAYTLSSETRLDLDGADRDPDSMAERVAELVTSMDPSSVAPIGIGLCAQLNRGGSLVANSPNLGWRDVPFASLVAARCGDRRVSVLNDLNAILLGEHAFGAARGVGDVIAAYPGTGLGGAVIIDRKLVEGVSGYAGELGHVRVADDGQCGCGAVGCLETVAGGLHIEARIARDLAAGRVDAARYGGKPTLRPDVVDEGARAGEPYADALWREISRTLGTALATLVAFLNPAMVLLGGGVIEHCPELLRRTTREILERSPEVSRRDLRVQTGELGWRAGMLGAAHHAFL